MSPQPEFMMPTRALQIRLFLTCWLVYSLHHATDFVREHYLVVSIVEEGSFDLTRYADLHVDIFRNPPEAPRGGAHHGANPGISLLAAIPNFALKPAVDRVVAMEQRSRPPADTQIVFRDETRPRRLAFYEATRRMGLDVRFALVALIATVLCMAPLAAASAVAVLRILGAVGVRAGQALALSLVYAFATPVFFRASFLNQNLGIAVFSIFGFLLLWNPGAISRRAETTRQALAGFLGGLSLLADYSGLLTLGLLGLYAVHRAWTDLGLPAATRAGLRYAAGAALPVLTLWFYQWRSFGNAFLPPQHWMPPVDWIEVGYQGVGGPTAELFSLLLFEPRYGLFPSSPVFVLALIAPFLLWRGGSALPRRELVFCYTVALAYLVFFSAVQYTRLQWVTGLRYLAPIVPFLFLPVALTLRRIPKAIAYALAVVSFVVTWSIAMSRDQTTILDSVLRFLLEGIRLPALTTFSRLSAQYAPWLQGDATPFPALLLLGAVLFAIWWLPRPWRSFAEDQADAHGAAGQ